MKKQILLTLFTAVFFLSGTAFAGNLIRTNHQASDTTHIQKKGNMKGMKMGNMKMIQSKTSQSHMANKNSIVRKGVINVESIDKNKDGKLYQDVMDWNVISDKPGTCPLCGMKLREMTIQQVKHNLKEHGFKYK